LEIEKQIPLKMQEQPLVSIVLCTYNGSAFLREQLDSIFSQTYQAVEIVIVDDASTDDTVSLLREYEAQHSCIRLFVNEQNIGYNRNFERGCRLATSDHIAIADQDDIWHHRKIELLMDVFEKVPGILIVHGHSAVFETGKAPHVGSVRVKRSFNGNDTRKLFLYNQISGHNMIIRRSLLIYALPFPENIYYDWWLAAVACCNGQIKGVDDILVYQRKHDRNATYVEKKPHCFYEAVQIRLPILLTSPNLSKRDKLFGETLIQKFSHLGCRKSSFRLFWYILRHGGIIFSFKYKLFPYISYVKHARRIASSSFRTP
jgi:glycosyltransferase involved in cell wall biosynthesis